MTKNRISSEILFSFMRQILLSVDGPLHNIVKIKPPMVFSKEDAGRLVRELDGILQSF